MTLVVAKIQNHEIGIVGDTKLTYPNHEIKPQKSNPAEGVIKLLIKAANICVCFAGEMDYAELAMESIKNSAELQQILDTLLEIHISCNGATEFLIAAAGDPHQLFEIKAGQCNCVLNAWIGDGKAFELFQGYYLGEIQKPPPVFDNRGSESNPQQNSIAYSEFEIKISTAHSAHFGKLVDAMDKLIDSGKVPSVGGFTTGVNFKEGFEYYNYMKMYRTPFVEYGNHAIGHGRVSDGSVSLNFIGGSLDHKAIAIHFLQADIGVLYCEDSKGMLRPTLYKLDEEDYYNLIEKKYKIYPKVKYQNLVIKYRTKGLKELDAKNYTSAISSFDKAISESHGQFKAEFYFYKGVALYFARHNQAGNEMFKKAVEINPSYLKEIDKFFGRKE